MRITPTEVHLSDPENYDKIYNISTKFYKPREFYDAFSTRTSMFGTESNELHRIRRAALSPFFSRKMVIRLEDVVQLMVPKLCRRVSDSLQIGKPVDIHYAFNALSVDIITEYAFNRSYDLLEQEDFGREKYFMILRQALPQMWVVWMWPTFRKLSMAMPFWLARRMSKAMDCMVGCIEVV